MDAISETAKKLKHLTYTDSQRLKIRLSEELFSFYRQADKISIVESLLSTTRDEKDKHDKTCKHQDCNKGKNLCLSEFLLIQELEQLGINTGQEIFTTAEQQNLISKLDKVINEIELLKLGHEIIYDDLKEEFDELKKLFYLSKKHWKQLFLGKLFEMAMAGIISESISRKILDLIQNETGKLLEQ